MKVGFDGSIKLEFHGTKVTSNGGLLAYRDQDDALGLFDSVSTVFNDKHTGRNVQHAMTTLILTDINPVLLTNQMRRSILITQFR